MSGIKIGHYEILSTLGRGSIGVVYKARDTRLGRIVAVKALKSIFLNNDSPENLELKRFYQESKAAGKLRHPNIVTIFDVGCTDLGSPYIVMDYIEGKTLSEVIDTTGPLPAEKVLSYLYPIASAIDYAHSQGVLHRDITPNNIIIDNNDHPFLLDFSLAKLLHQSITPTGTMLGSPGYMAPELIDGGQSTKSSDIFSLGVLAYELCTGQAPFEGDDIVRIVFAVMNEQPRSFADVGVDLPKKLERVIGKAVSKKPEDRYGSAVELVQAIEKAFAEVTGAYQREALNESGNKEQIVSESASALDEVKHSWGDFKERTTNSFDFHSDSEPEEISSSSQLTIRSVANIVMRTCIILSVLTSSLLVADKLFPATFSKLEFILLNIGSEIADKKMVEGYKNIEEIQPLDPERFSQSSDKKLKALLKRGTSINGAKDLEILRAAIFASSTRADKDFTASLISLSSHPDELVRIEALRALSHQTHALREGVRGAFVARLTDRDYLVRGFSIRALSEFGDRQVLEVLKQQKALEKNDFVREILDEAVQKLQSRLSAASTGK